ncbi:MAG: glycosyltransferase family 2 protein [Selenomonadaceae bacterium]|nr:glycosyltransferase family 2 protein [Selenomonadaceae bacterium]
MEKEHSVDERLYIVIPAYNEEANIHTVLSEWYPLVEKIGSDSRLVVVDDGSRDNTYPLLQDFAKEHPQMIALTKSNGGHGATLLYAYRYALEAGADYIFQTDSDGQTRPAEFWPFWEARQDYDMIIGHRNHREDGLSRIFVTKVLKYTLLLTFGVTVTDANTPFRLMKASVLRETLPLVPTDFNLANVIITVIYTLDKRRILYRPITFRPRQGGVNSINLSRIFRIGLKAVQDFYRINRQLKARDNHET